MSAQPSVPSQRRSASMPSPKPQPHTRSPDTIEVLFSLPSVRIISFTSTSPNHTSRPATSSGAKQDEEIIPGSLPWTSRFERTIAMGNFRIYKAPGSVAFLNCNAALRPILPKSQCWLVSVEGSSKLVLQIKPPQYWRIEVPNSSPGEKKSVQALQKVLESILLFEKTPCPFQREWTVSLPEQPEIRFRPWKPTERVTSHVRLPPKGRTHPVSSRRSSAYAVPSALLPIASFSSAAVLVDQRIADLEAATVNETMQRAVGLEGRTGEHDSTQAPAAVSLAVQASDCGVYDRPRDTEAMRPLTPVSFAIPDWGPPDSLPVEAQEIADMADLSYFNLKPEDSSDEEYSDATDEARTPTNPSLLQSLDKPRVLRKASRSITAPPILSMVTSPPSKYQKTDPLEYSTSVGSNAEFSSSVESFHSSLSWHTPLAPISPPRSETSYPTAYSHSHEKIKTQRRTPDPQAKSKPVALPVMPVLDSRSTSPSPKTPTSVSHKTSVVEECFEIATSPATRSRHRGTTGSNSRRRTLSPLPSAVNLFSPPNRARRLRTGRHLPTAIIQKTCEILLSPPSHLLNLMLNIASKIAAGEWRGVFLYEEERVNWELSEDELYDVESTDDFGMPLHDTRIRNREYGSNMNVGEGWEVD